MKEEKYIELIAQHLAGEISESNRKELMEWVDADAKNQALLNEATQLWKVTENYDSEFDTNVEVAWAKVEKTINETGLSSDSSAKIIRLSNFKRILQIAAVILIGVAGWLWFSQNQDIEPQLYAYQTNDEQTQEIFLPDSTQVVLNENSQLTYIDKDGKRNLTLEGEAWFDVKHMEDKPFEILSGEAKTRVLGTAFNLRAYPDEDIIEVSVERGRVEFSEKINAENKVELPIGTEGVFYKKEKKVEKEERINENANSWRTLTIECDNINLDKVFGTLERYFEVKFVPEDPLILNCRFFGTYENPTIDFFIENINEAMDLQFVKEGNTYKVSGEPCKPEG